MTATRTPGAAVRALEALWQKVSAKPLWLPPHFWRYLRLRRRIELRELARSDVRISTPLPVANNCRACTDTCCVGKKNTVSLRLIDIAWLLDGDRTDLIAADKPTFTDSEMSAARRRFTESRTFAMFPVLRQDAAERCAALGPSGACSLYPHWPLSCARFPYSLDLSEREIFYSPRCGSLSPTASFAEPRVRMMIDATLAAYNQRIRDWILCDYAWGELTRIGLTRFLHAG
jgi:Fe-S-cluster containining protein